MARRMLFEFAAEQPGADMLELPRTVQVPLVLVGIIVAALAEAMQVRAANESSDRLGGVVAAYGQVLSGFGQITADAASGQAGDPAGAMFPAALLRRAARQISNAADMAASGGSLPDGVPEAARARTGRGPPPGRRRAAHSHHHGVKGCSRGSQRVAP